MMNPVLRKEAITTMRSWKTYGALVLFLVISAVGAMLYIDLSMFQKSVTAPRDADETM